MNLQEILQIFRDNNIPSSLYSVGGLGLGECVGIAKEDDKWQTYYSERGGKSSIHEFSNEAETCEDFLRRVKNSASELGLQIIMPKYYKPLYKVIGNKVYFLVQGKGWMEWKEPEGGFKEKDLITEEQARQNAESIGEEY